MKMKKVVAAVAALAVITSGTCMVSLAVAAPEETAEASAAQAEIVEVTGGQIQGGLTEDGEIAYYKGIPYAAPPVGDLRWKEPQDVIPWDGVLETTEFGPSSYQGAESAFGNYTDEFLNSNRNYSEDSLTVNVWTQAERGDELAPVIFYIHGGGNTSGGSSCPIYDGEIMARKGIVFTSLNYRLDKFGFYASSALSEESEHGVSGNYAIFDILKALQWVNDNIESFGGDPDNITIIGQSAGAGNVGTLTISPLGAGLFEQAAGWSSLGVIDTFEQQTLEEAESSGDSMGDSYGLDLEGLRETPAEDIREMYGSFSTIKDGYAVVDSTLNTFLNGTENDVPTMTGMVNGDAGLFGTVSSDFAPYLGLNEEEYVELIQASFGDYADEVLELYPANGDNSYGMALALNIDAALYRFPLYGKARAVTAATPTYIYYYDHDYAGLPEQGAFHSSDIPYWLGGVFTEDKTFSDVDYQIADIMSGYLVNFVTDGDVNGEGLNEWPAYGEAAPGYLYISDDGAEYVEFNPIKYNFWDEYYSALCGLEATPLDVAEDDAAALAEDIEAMKAAADAVELLPIIDDDPENPTLQLEKGEGTSFTVAEWAAGAWQPVATTGMYPVKAYALDGEGNIIGYLDVEGGFGDYSEYPDAAAIGVMSSFTGFQKTLDLN